MMKKMMLLMVLVLMGGAFAAKQAAMVPKPDDFKAAVAQRHTLLPVYLKQCLYSSSLPDGRRVIRLGPALEWVTKNIHRKMREAQAIYHLYEELRNLEIILQCMADNSSWVSGISFEVARDFAHRLMDQWVAACTHYIQAEHKLAAADKNYCYGYQEWLNKEAVIDAWLTSFYGLQKTQPWTKSYFDNLKKALTNT